MYMYVRHEKVISNDLEEYRGIKEPFLEECTCIKNLKVQHA